MYICFTENKYLIVSWYNNTIPRYDIAGKKTILLSIPILKILMVSTLEKTFNLYSCASGSAQWTLPYALSF
jgi:hypothetical protein